jgi:DNA-binding XRE family transcriptional regulator
VWSIDDSPDLDDSTSSKHAVQEAFGHNLRACRHRAGLSQYELAALGGLHGTYIGQIERGERNLTLYNILRLSWGLQLPVEALLAGIGPWATRPRPTAAPDGPVRTNERHPAPPQP